MDRAPSSPGQLEKLRQQQMVRAFRLLRRLRPDLEAAIQRTEAICLRKPAFSL
jgi:hypothetical protein